MNNRKFKTGKLFFEVINKVRIFFSLNVKSEKFSTTKNIITRLITLKNIKKVFLIEFLIFIFMMILFILL